MCYTVKPFVWISSHIFLHLTESILMQKLNKLDSQLEFHNLSQQVRINLQTFGHRFHFNDIGRIQSLCYSIQNWHTRMCALILRTIVPDFFYRHFMLIRVNLIHIFSFVLCKYQHFHVFVDILIYLYQHICTRVDIVNL